MPEGLFAQLIDGVRQTSQEPIDFNFILMAKLASVLSTGLGTNERAKELADLQSLSSNYQDSEWKSWKEQFDKVVETHEKHGELKKYRAAVHRELTDHLLALLKRAGFLPAGTWKE